VNQKLRLTQRSDIVNELYDGFAAKGILDQRMIIIHVDSRGKREQTDTFLYAQSHSEASKRIGRNMLKTLERHYGRFRDFEGTLSSRDLHMLRECKPATVFVEIGNIRNAFDRKRITEARNRQFLAEWLTEGFVK
jgi:N-acetylmuramoyl-L-alanine amidase